MDYPFYSVVVPVYNKEKTVTNCIQSILDQTWTDLEVIIVCDPSSDASQHKIQAFKDPRIKIYYRDQPGPGGYAARNLGIAKATGYYIAFLDADDEWFAKHLETMQQHIKNNPEIAVFTCGRYIIKNGKSKQDRAYAHLEKRASIFSFQDYLYLSIHHEHPFHANTVIVRNDSPSLVKFPESGTERGGDLYAWVMLAYRAEYFLWVPHISANLYKEKHLGQKGHHSMLLPMNLANDLAGDCQPETARLLKQYANRLIYTAYEKQATHHGCTEARIQNCFFWKDDFWFCLGKTLEALFSRTRLQYRPQDSANLQSP